MVKVEKYTGKEEPKVWHIMLAGSQTQGVCGASWEDKERAVVESPWDGDLGKINCPDCLAWRNQS